MDALQFGQWLSEQRRRHGWRSQRAFVETAQQEPLLQELHISEDFVGRLEAGLLVHPFKGSVRRRVLALARLLCKTPRELRTYLQAAELSQLSVDEKDYLERLTRSIKARQAPAPLLLPPRPTHLLGRSADVQELLHACTSVEQGICVVTGMPGVGKSALAYEVVHQLAASRQERMRLFPDGIVTLTCTGRRGPAGLLALLDEISEIFAPAARQANRQRKMQREQVDAGSPEAALAGAIDRARLALVGKRALLLLDDLDAQFPVRLAHDALLARGWLQTSQESEDGESTRLVILATSRYILPPLLSAYRLHVEPLEPEDACELFITLLGRTPGEEESEAVRRICAAVGYLPLAVEEAATAVVVEGISLELLAVRAEEYPLDRLLDGSGEVRARLSRALETMNPQLAQRFALLSLLGAQFGLEAAASTQATTLHKPATLPDHVPGNSWQLERQGIIVSNGASSIALPPSNLASTASDLGQMVRHSLIEPVSTARTNGASTAFVLHHLSPGNETRYHMHPLLLAHASDALQLLDTETRQAAQQNIRAYALDYVQRYSGDMMLLERERHFLTTIVERAWEEQQYALVIDLVWGLRPILYLGPGFFEEPKRLLYLGAAASEQLKQQRYLSRFMNHLGVLYYCTGDFAQAIRMYQECLEIIETHEGPHAHFLWLPLINLAVIDSLLGNHDAARRRADAYFQLARESSDAAQLAGAHFLRGHIALRHGDIEHAYDDLRESERLFASVPDSALSFSWAIEKLYASADLARARGDYEKACEYTWKLSRAFGGRLHADIAEAWFDMAYYAYRQGLLDDARVMAQRALDMATQIGAHHVRKLCLELLSQITEGYLALPRQR